jgi:CMP-N-acetylneuraminic acid synthetase
MRTLGVITARGGSKGIPRKNIKPLCGKPLLYYTADAALKAQRLTRVILSTEDEEIAAVGLNLGLQVPFLRPRELAADDTPSLPVVRHAVGFLEAQEEFYDAICLLQPTSPLRAPKNIDDCIQLLEESDADSVVSVVRVPINFNPHKIYFQDDDGLLYLSTGRVEPIIRRQDVPVAFRRDGSVYVTRRNVLIEKGSLYGSRVRGFLMSEERSIDIDSPEDWAMAERMLTRRNSH